MFPAVSVAPLAANLGVTVPAPQEPTLTVRVVPDEALGVKVQPVAPVGFEKSPAAIPVTASENVMV
jgi:hypothetical protein